MRSRETSWVVSEWGKRSREVQGHSPDSGVLPDVPSGLSTHVCPPVPERKEGSVLRSTCTEEESGYPMKDSCLVQNPKGRRCGTNVTGKGDRAGRVAREVSTGAIVGRKAHGSDT